MTSDSPLFASESCHVGTDVPLSHGHTLVPLTDLTADRHKRPHYTTKVLDDLYGCVYVHIFGCWTLTYDLTNSSPPTPHTI